MKLGAAAVREAAPASAEELSRFTSVCYHGISLNEASCGFRGIFTMSADITHQSERL